MSNSDHLVQGNLRFNVLTHKQKESLHTAVLHILSNVGIRLYSDEALRLLGDAGAFVDINNKLAKIPEDLINKAISSAPKRVVLYDRYGNQNCTLEHDKVYFGTFGTAPYIYDLITGERRRVVRADLEQAARFLNHLPNIQWCQPIGSAPEDGLTILADRYQLHAFLLYYSKPIVASAYSLDGMRDQIEMCSVIAGGIDKFRERPFYVAPIDPTSPLCFGSEPLSKLFYAAECGLPIALNCAPIVGATSPMTIASPICLATAESLCALVLAQLKRKGTPVILGGEPCLLDMATTVTDSGAPEATLMKLGLTELIHSYGLPVYTLGGATAANVPDQQAAIEASLSMLPLALCGANLVQGPGAIDQGMTISFDYLVMCNEIIAQIKRLMGGVSVTEESIQLDLIEKIGPGGHFLNTDQTYAHFREFLHSNLVQREKYEIWETKGQPVMSDLIHDTVGDIVREPVNELVSVEEKKELQAILRSAEKKAM